MKNKVPGSPETALWERMEEMSKKLDEENLKNVWERVFLLIRKITGNVDVAGRGTLQDQISDHGGDTDNPHKVTAKQLGLDKVENAPVSDQKPEFQAASARENIKSGEKLSVSLGKIQKWFSDLKGGAFAPVANNLTTTMEGSVLDARQGKVLHEMIEEQNNNLGGNTLIYNESEDAYYIQHGADSVLKKLGSSNISLFATYGLSVSGETKTVFTAQKDCVVNITIFNCTDDDVDYSRLWAGSTYRDGFGTGKKPIRVASVTVTLKAGESVRWFNQGEYDNYYQSIIHVVGYYLDS